mmetsp:Transcript_3840/g.3936  ORF Transcript_3840/g.3936 Transcript_3840/m.3936 type:complete len:205 (+) Transcript_3840:987-1601(+)
MLPIDLETFDDLISKNSAKYFFASMTDSSVSINIFILCSCKDFKTFATDGIEGLFSRGEVTVAVRDATAPEIVSIRERRGTGIQEEVVFAFTAAEDIEELVAGASGGGLVAATTALSSLGRREAGLEEGLFPPPTAAVTAASSTCIIEDLGCILPFSPIDPLPLSTKEPLPPIEPLFPPFCTRASSVDEGLKCPVILKHPVTVH